MERLQLGDAGAEAALLQLALRRAGFDPGPLDGRFGPKTAAALRAFQSANGLTPDAVAGPATYRALEPWFLGRVRHTVRAGDSLYRVAARYGSSVAALETANPGLDPQNLRVGSTLTVPLAFDAVPTDIPWSAALVDFAVRGLAARYPALGTEVYGRSAMGKPLYALRLGAGENRVLYNAAHHANEWLTTPLLLRFAEDLLRAAAGGERLFGVPASELLAETTVVLAPCVNPDGMDLVTGALNRGPWFDRAAAIAGDYPAIPFPAGWKANLRGTDPNLQYPAGWEQAREIKFAQGFTAPAPRDYVGPAPLSAPESRGLYDLARETDPALTLSYHSQGRVIYWKYLDMEPPGARAIGERFARVSGYLLDETPYASGFAGFKDWFILNYNRPGYTVEVGVGDNPLPLSQFDEIYRDNLGILTLGAAVTSPALAGRYL